jgi:predicted metalloprotease with PDZ domain
MSEEFVNHAAHEFFHIITPLTIHSEEIQFFDFNTPKMSQHLWLYEGSTEYHANMVREKYGIISPEALLNRLSGKITNSRSNYNDTVAFTKMSANVLGAYKDQFGNVYQKGALITMCLDIKLLQLSHGKYGIMNLIHDLSNKYGKQKGFKDPELFTEIEKLSYPEIKQFLDTYVGGTMPLPFEEIFSVVGINFKPVVETKDSVFSLGKIAIGFDPQTNRLKVNDTTGMNSLGRSLGYQKNDEIISINGKELSAQNANGVIGNLYKTAKVGDSLVIKVMRNNSPVELKAAMIKVPVMKYNVLTFNEGATQEQLMLRDAWLKPHS